ncbi:MAG TPA: glycerol-3-phosphate dehydrogenase subunit GlpB [Spirochaetota bacterium]|nr:glycerol-3-phosphate dehydrogenase subunit GlpB [Spirochaetota bacterium]
MNYDCLIIGGGISGLTCGIKCVSEGLRCGILSSGMSALHFSSGSIDLYGYHTNRKIVYQPLDYIERLIIPEGRHPYSKCGIDMIREGISFFSETLEKEGLVLYHNNDYNHFHVSTMGTVKPTYLSQRSVFNDNIKEGFKKRSKIAILNFSGFRDFYPELAAENLRKNSLFSLFDIITGEIELPLFRRTEKNPHEFRSMDIARIFDSEKYLPGIANQIVNASGGALFVGLPAFIGINNFTRIYQRLSELTGMLIYEIPTLPPSILGMRIDDALKSRFAALGGEFIAGDTVNGGEIVNGVLDHIHTENHGSTRLRSKFFVLSSGSFFSRGLVSEFNMIREPVFNLKVAASEDRREWYSPSFFQKESHPFLEYGVVTNNTLNPEDAQGATVENLFCTGAILPHYNPIREGCGGGVAISTGYFAAKKIIEGCRS